MKERTGGYGAPAMAIAMAMARGGNDIGMAGDEGERRRRREWMTCLSYTHCMPSTLFIGSN